MLRPPILAFTFAAATDIGCKRSNNEDCFGYDAEQGIFVVCDGMGGSAAGEVASSMAVQTLIESFGVPNGELVATEVKPVEDRLLNAIVAANRAVRDAGNGNPDLNHMGTTLVCACLDGDRAVVANVGDSRAYLLREGTCSQITQDHSFLAEEVRKGNITPEMAAASDLQSVITRAIGAGDTVEPDLFAARLQAGDLLLLATDGLTRYASAEEILAASNDTEELASFCNKLIEHAKRGGGADNITCIALRATEAAPGTDGYELEDGAPAI